MIYDIFPLKYLPLKFKFFLINNINLINTINEKY